MIPLRDVIPSGGAPLVTIGLIALNALVWLFEVQRSTESLQQIVAIYGVVPARFTWPTVLTSQFVHGSWLHFVGNMLYLWIFGDNVENRLGRGGYLLFYLSSGIVPALAYVAASPDSTIPMVGASGAIAGVLGAYFVMFPHSRVLTLIPLIVFWDVIELPTLFFLGVWFLMPFVAGGWSIVRTTADAGSLTFWAHAAGFASGAAGIAMFRSRARWRVEW